MEFFKFGMRNAEFGIIFIPYKYRKCRNSVGDGFPVPFECIMFDMNHNLMMCIDQIVSAILTNVNSE